MAFVYRMASQSEMPPQEIPTVDLAHSEDAAQAQLRSLETSQSNLSTREKAIRKMFEPAKLPSNEDILKRKLADCEGSLKDLALVNDGLNKRLSRASHDNSTVLVMQDRIENLEEILKTSNEINLNRELKLGQYCGRSEVVISKQQRKINDLREQLAVKDDLIAKKSQRLNELQEGRSEPLHWDEAWAPTPTCSTQASKDFLIPQTEEKVNGKPISHYCDGIHRTGRKLKGHQRTAFKDKQARFLAFPEYKKMEYCGICFKELLPK